jgi:type VI secretion system protein ImpG
MGNAEPDGPWGSSERASSGLARRSSGALLGVLYPHYLAPIQSMSIVECVIDPAQGKLTGGHFIPRGTVLYSQPVSGTPCRFRTCYPVTLWPIEVTAARVEDPDRQTRSAEAVAAIRLELRCLGGMTFAQLELDRLRFFLSGESQLTYGLYELLLNNVCEVQLRVPGEAGDRMPLSSSRGSVPGCRRTIGRKSPRMTPC